MDSKSTLPLLTFIEYCSAICTVRSDHVRLLTAIPTKLARVATAARARRHPIGLHHSHPTCMPQLQGSDNCNKSSPHPPAAPQQVLQHPVTQHPAEGQTRAAQPAAATLASFAAHCPKVRVTEAGTPADAHCRREKEAYQRCLAPRPALAGYWCT